MVGSIDTIGASVGGAVPQGGIAPVSSGASPSFASTVSSVSLASAASLVSHSPRVVQDPSAGFITQYLSANGSQVVSQTPSVITVAYLRLGLTAEGLSKQSSVGTTA